MWQAYVKFESIKYCSTVYLRWQISIDSASEIWALVRIITRHTHAKNHSHLRFFHETTGYSNLKTMPIRSTTVLSRRQNYNIWVFHPETWCYNHQALFLGSVQQNISLVSLFLILAVQINFVKMAGSCSSHHLRSHLSL